MKNKKLLIIFLCFVLLVLPLKQSLAAWWNPLDWIKGALGWVTNNLKEPIVKGIAGIIYWLTYGVHQLLFFINNSLLAPIIDAIAQLNPFKDDVIYKDEQGQQKEVKSPITVIWNILKNLAYILLVFSALAAAYEWLLGQDANAKRLIFNIIIVALLINFTFVLVKEAFLVVDSFEKGITGGESKKIGTMIAASLWQRDPFSEIIGITGQLGNENEEADVVLKSLAQVIGYIFIIVFDMLILIILVITGVLFFVRYLMIIFLAGTSSIALATLVFPEFKGALSKVMATFKAWDTWLEYFLRWLLVIPVFIILVILGNILKENTLGQLKGMTSGIGANVLIEFVMLLFMLGGWYLMSIRIANQISKGIANMGKAAATAAMLTVGGLAARGLMSAVGPTVGRVLERGGSWLTRRAPATRFGAWIAKPGQWAYQKGTGLQQKYSQGKIDLINNKMDILTQQLRTAQTPQQRQQIASEIRNLINQNQRDRFALDALNRRLAGLSDREKDRLLSDDAALQALIGNSDQLDLQAQQSLANFIRGASKRTMQRFLENGNLLDTVTNVQNRVASNIVDAVSEGIEGLTQEEFLRSISGDRTGRTMNIIHQQIQQNTRLGNAINNVTTIFQQIASGTQADVERELSNLGIVAGRYEEVIRNFANMVGQTQKVVNAYINSLNTDIITGIAQGLRNNSVVIGELRQRYGTVSAATQALNLSDPNAIRLLSTMW